MPGAGSGNWTLRITYQSEYGTVPTATTKTIPMGFYSLTENDLPEISAEGYTFLGWAKTDGGSEYYAVGDGFTSANGNITMYAAWEMVENGGGNKMSTRYVIMPEDDYVDACDSLRSKTGTENTIVSGQLSGLIDGIENAMIEGAGLNANDELILTASGDVSVMLYNENLLIQVGEQEADNVSDVSEEGA